MSLLWRLARELFLVARVHATWPGFPDDIVREAVRAAVAEESSDLPAEVLLAVAQHESDLRPNAVSYVRHGRRVDVLWTPTMSLPGHVVCGYLQAMMSSKACVKALQNAGGMHEGAVELRSWIGLCRGNVACALAGHCVRRPGAPGLPRPVRKFVRQERREARMETVKQYDELPGMSAELRLRTVNALLLGYCWRCGRETIGRCPCDHDEL